MQATLRKTTAFLSRELARPGEVAPDWSAFEWQVARAVAALHGVSPLLAATLRWRGPPEWAEFLHVQRLHTIVHQARIQELLTRIERSAREQGITLIALKGAALHRIGLYRAGDRPMSDVDLLVPLNECQLASSLLQSLGYQIGVPDWQHIVFEPNESPVPAAFGEHAANGIKVELHCFIREALPVRQVELTNLVMPGSLHPGINDYPSNAALMAHLLLHAAGNMVARSLRMLHLHDIGRLAARMSNHDWQVLLGQSGKASGLWWAFAPLTLVARDYDRIPEWALAAARAECPWRLRRACVRMTLSDVSLSDIWIDALPGTAWLQSFDELFSYLTDRLMQGARLLSRRNSPAPAIPHVDARTDQVVEWRRGLRWTWRPTRPAVVHAIRSALSVEQPQISSGIR
jgi:hypothetical protein